MRGRDGLTTDEPMTKLRAARLSTEPPWSQMRLVMEMQRVAHRLGITLPDARSLKVSISRWENGHVHVERPEYRRVLCAVFGLTEEELGLDRAPTAPSLPAKPAAPRIDREILSYYDEMLREHAAADNLMGPRHLLDVVGLQTQTLATAARNTRGPIRHELLAVVSRYHEFLGWLYQDAGNTEAAMRLTDRAMDYAIELHEPMTTAYLLMRKSNIATDTASPDLALPMIEAALGTSGELPPRICATILRQKANAHAVLGEPAECADAMARAYDHVEVDDPVGAQRAPYCTAAYLDMEAASCWTRLGRPDEALSVFRERLAERPTTLRRDGGLSLARLATAHATVGELERACVIGHRAVQVGHATGSARIARELLQLRRRLAPWRKRDNVSELTVAIGSLAGGSG
jgi:tetratricopeptide (TPR) repeat protein